MLIRTECGFTLSVMITELLRDWEHESALERERERERERECVSGKSYYNPLMVM